MNGIQEKAFQLLKEFIRICDSLKLNYYLVCGSALGAVKYSGFIPWDDDIDVALYREDYEVFCRKAPQMLPSHFFLQNYNTERCFSSIYSKLRDSNTTCIENSVASFPMNHGICIDVFPLDGYPSDKKEQRKLELRKLFYVRLLNMHCVRNNRWKEEILKPFRKIIAIENLPKIAESYTKEIMRWPVETSQIIANHGNWQGKKEYHLKNIYGAGTMAKFEGLSVRIPSDYNSYLIQKYGDYHKDPPLDQQKSHHSYRYLDAERSYMDYLKLLQ